MTGFGYEQQVVTWTGNSVADRLIQTSFPLDSGVVAIWISGLPAASNNIDAFRHNGSAMLGTCLMGNNTLETTTGIMAFTESGFTVTGGTLVGLPYVNVSGVKYTAIVMRDTSTDNRYLRVGSYTGLGSFGTSMTVIGPPGGYQSAVTSAGTFLPIWDGLVGSDASGSYAFTYETPSTGIIRPGYTGGPFIPPAPGSVGINLNFPAGDRTVVTPGRATQLTHAWVWTGLVAYHSEDFADNYSVILSSQFAFPPKPGPTNLIKSLGEARFTVGTDTQVNFNGRLFHYMALAADATFANAHLFKSFKVRGTSATPSVVASGLGFTPVLAYAALFDVVLGVGCAWRGSDQAGLHSTYCSGAGDLASQGIRAIGSDSLDIGNEIAPDGLDCYGWAFAASGEAHGGLTRGWQLQRFDARLRREGTL